MPQGCLGPSVNHISVYNGPWGYFITKSHTREAQTRREAAVAKHHGHRPLYRINLRRK